MVALAPIPLDESARLMELYKHHILDTPPDERFDLFTQLCTWLYSVPAAAINFIDAERTFFKSIVGLPAYQPARETSICAHAVGGPDMMMVVEDLARDERFHDHPLVAKGLRFYAGAMLLSRSGQRLGTLCIADTQPRLFTEEERRKLSELAKGVGAVLDLHCSTQQLRDAASQDALTGLCNRRLFMERLTSAVARAEPDDPCVLLCLDLDGFKQVNDTFGHAGGDALLCEASRRLTDTTRAGDTVARLGGDEFAILVRGHSTIASIEQLAQRILAAFSQPYSIEASAVPLRGSIGIAMCSDKSMAAAELMRLADTALYRAKQGGRGQYQVYRAGDTMGQGR